MLRWCVGYPLIALLWWGTCAFYAAQKRVHRFTLSREEYHERYTSWVMPE